MKRVLYEAARSVCKSVLCIWPNLFSRRARRPPGSVLDPPQKSQESQEEHDLQFFRKTKIRGVGQIWDETRRVNLCLNQRAGTVFAKQSFVRFQKQQNRLLELFVEEIW